MTSPITISYQGATFTANTATIIIGNGGSFQLTNNEFLSFNGSFTFDALNISSGSIDIYNSKEGVPVNGGITIPVMSGAGGDPTITATNFQGSVTISWPSSQGPQYDQLSPGDPLTLTVFTG
jgi:hypothetical protein